jgi:hypothetical protein
VGQKNLIRTTASIGEAPGVVLPLGAFKTFSGGGLKGSSVMSVKAAGLPERATGGRQTVEDVTIGREDDGTIDLIALGAQRNRVKMTVTRQPLDQNLNPFGPSWTYTGILTEVNPGDGDAQDENDLDEFTLVMACDSVVS